MNAIAIPPGWRVRRAAYLAKKRRAVAEARAKRLEPSEHDKIISALKCMWLLVPRNKRKAGKNTVRDDI